MEFNIDKKSVGLLIVGHGTSSEVGTAQFLTLVERIRTAAADRFVIEPAFLEIRQPDIDTAVGRLLDRGATRLITMPLLLFAAGHAKSDVPNAVAAALSRRGRADVRQIQADHLGCHPALLELSRRKMEEAVQWAVPTSGKNGKVGQAHPACLLLVGRGSRDELATAEMHEFGCLRQQFSPDMKIHVAFLAMARPLLRDKLPEIARQGFGRVIVQPHLLFYGDLFESLQRQVAEIAADCPDIKWIVTQPLADEPGIVGEATKLLEKVILDRCQEAAIHVVPKQGDD